VQKEEFKKYSFFNAGMSRISKPRRRIFGKGTSRYKYI